MKISKTLLTILLLFSAIGCTGVKSTANYSESDNASADNLSGDRSAYDLVDYLTRIPGVLVEGGGHNVSVTIRGPNSFMFSTQPLFVVNGQILGRDFNRARNSVVMHEIERVRVLRGNDAAIYGFEGANGVIIIQTKGNINAGVLD